MKAGISGKTGSIFNMSEKFCGTAIKLGDNINTDIIFPGAYMNISDPFEMAKHALEGISEDFPSRIEEGSIVVGGVNFGCGSSREGAVTSLKYAGVVAIITKSFSRIYYRNVINQGLMPVECSEAVGHIADGQEICISLSQGKVWIGSKSFDFVPPPAFVQEILKEGGLLNYTKRKIAL